MRSATAPAAAYHTVALDSTSAMGVGLWWNMLELGGMLTIVPRAPAALAASTPWQVVVDAFLAGACDSASPRRTYSRPLSRAFALLGVKARPRVTRALPPHPTPPHCTP